jgi:hypothetical protein
MDKLSGKVRVSLGDDVEGKIVKEVDTFVRVFLHNAKSKSLVLSVVISEDPKWHDWDEYTVTVQKYG